MKNEKPDPEIQDAWIRDPANYKLLVFYYNPQDKRIFPPKRSGLGWTINFANPYSVLTLVVSLLFFTVCFRYFN